jgi:hypothetical protein
LTREFEGWIYIITANYSADSTTLKKLQEIVQVSPRYDTAVADYSRHFDGYGADLESWPDELKIRFFLRYYSRAVALLQHEIFLNSYHKTFLLTRDGYMGTCPRWAEAGDSVVLIAGLKVPFIVRKAGEYYRLIGPAYIEGIMHGERWQESEARSMTFV